MLEIITFPDIEWAVQDYLTTTFDDPAAIVRLVPDPRPTRMVKVARTGGARTSLVLEDAQVTVECWDSRPDRAHDLAQLIRGLLWAMPDRYRTVTTYRVADLGGVTNFPDPDTANPRYTFTVLITTRGTAIP